MIPRPLHNFSSFLQIVSFFRSKDKNFELFLGRFKELLFYFIIFGVTKGFFFLYKLYQKGSNMNSFAKVFKYDLLYILLQ